MRRKDRARCRDCVYSFTANVGEENEMLPACIYILFGEKKQRPCPAGAGCTVFERRRTPEETGGPREEENR